MGNLLDKDFLSDQLQINTDLEKSVDFKYLMNFMSNYVCIRDYNGDIVFINDAFAKKLNSKAETLIDKNFTEILDSSNKRTINNILENDQVVFEEGNRMIVNETLIVDEKVIKLETVKIPINNERLLCLSKDLTKEFKHQRLMDQLNETNAKIQDFIHFSENISTMDSYNEEEFWINFFNSANRLVDKCDYGSIFIYKDQKVKYIKAIGHDEEILKSLDIDHEKFLQEERKNKIWIKKKIHDVSKENDFYQGLVEATKPIKESITFNIYLEGQPIGGMSLDIAEGSEKSYTDNDQRLLKLILNMAQYFYKQKNYNRFRQDFTKEVALTLIKILELRDEYTEGHSRYVANLSAMLAEQLNLSQALQDKTMWAGLLHDIGKISVPEEVLNKAGTLTSDEYEVIKSHAEWGYLVLNQSDWLKDISTYVLHHHERWDGQGYPNGLKGDEIPLISQILTVADAWNAMLSVRSYRNPLSTEEAIKEIQKNKGTQFSPTIVETLLTLIDQGKVEGLKLDTQETNFQKLGKIQQQTNSVYFDEFFQKSNEAITILDEEFKIIKVNSYFKQLFQFNSNDIVGKSIAKTIIPKEKLKETGRYIQQLKNGYEVNSETYRITKNGTRVDVMIKAFPITEGQNTIGYCIIYRDISDLKTVERKYESIEKRYTSLFNNGTTPMLIINPDNGKIIDANRAAENFYGWEKEQLTTMNISDINLLSRDEIHQAMTRAKTKDTFEFVFQHRLKNGAVKDVQVYSQPVIFEDEEYLFSIVHEVTAKKMHRY